MPDHDPNMPMVGDRIKVVMPPHMPGHDEGVIRQMVGMAMGIEFDSMPGEVHHWYVPSEVMVTKKANGAAGGESGGEMTAGATARVFRIPPFVRASEYAGVWAIEPSAAIALSNMIASMDFAAHMAAQQPGRGGNVDMQPGRDGKSVAVIKATGLLMKQQSSMGGTSTIQLRRDIRQAASDPNVSGILLAIDSPGGTAAGTADLAAEVKSATRKKPVWAHIDDLGASAAYWAASQADMIFANTASALVGSIGTIQTVYDMSAAAEKEGIKTLVFATGPLKGAGVSGTAITEEQQAYFQGIVNAIQESFDAGVKSGRGMNATQLKAVKSGGVFSATQAMELKLIDGIQSLDKTLASLTNAK